MAFFLRIVSLYLAFSTVYYKCSTIRLVSIRGSISISPLTHIIAEVTVLCVYEIEEFDCKRSCREQMA